MMISADSHVIESADVYASLVPRWGERSPVVRRADDGTDWWWVDAQRTNSFAPGTQAGRRFEDTDALVLSDSIDNVRSQVWSPDRYVDDNVADGVVASILYPTQQLQHYAVRNSALVADTCRVYNDWLAEFCATRPDRLRGVAALNSDDPRAAAAELDRAISRGLAGAMLPVGLPHGATYADRCYEPIWNTAAALGVPVSFHIGTYRANPARDKVVVIAGAQTATTRPVQSAFTNADSYVRNVLADLIFSGVLERHPELRIVSAEHEIGWFAHFVERMDHTYTQRATRGYRFADAAVPSDFVRRQVFVQFCEDPLAPVAIDAVGARNVLWGSDYPHSEGTFPRSRELVSTILASCRATDRRSVLIDNSCALYGIDVKKLAA